MDSSPRAHLASTHLPPSSTSTSASSPTLPPPTPIFILRAHNASIHALHFFASNALLASGDADGWLVLWSLATKRPRAVWRAHEGGVNGIRSCDGERLITHGRDHKLKVWQVREGDLEGLDCVIPGVRQVDHQENGQGQDGIGEKQPWLLHCLPMNALNFCVFGMCYEEPERSHPNEHEYEEEGERSDVKVILIAAPNALDNGGIDVFQLPSERRVSRLPSDRSIKTGMVMAVSLFFHAETGLLILVSGYEDGRVMVHARKDQQSSQDEWDWDRVLVMRPHSQPVLSVDVDLRSSYCFTSSADAMIAKIAIPGKSIGKAESNPDKVVNTKHAGQQGLAMRSDGKIFATAGWDARVRVYSAKTLKELAVLKWHTTSCNAVAFAEIDPFQSTTKPKVDLRQLMVSRKNALEAIKQERSDRAQNMHWLAAGGKDGKISLWNIY